MGLYHSLRVQLYKNSLTDSENDYYARPAVERSLTADEVGEEAVSRGEATMTATEIVRGFNEFMKEATYETCNGYSVNTDYFKISVVINGTFTSATDTFDSSRHDVHFVITPNSAMRTELENISITTDGIADVGPTITQVTNCKDGSINSVITPGHALTIEGEKLKVSGDDASCGVYLIASDGTETQISGSDILTNEPKNLMVLVPSDLAAGTYNIRVTTQYSTSTYNTSSPRSTSSDIELTVS